MSIVNNFVIGNTSQIIVEPLQNPEKFLKDESIFVPTLHIQVKKTLFLTLLSKNSFFPRKIIFFSNSANKTLSHILVCLLGSTVLLY